MNLTAELIEHPFLRGLHFILGPPLGWIGEWFTDWEGERFMAKIRKAGERCPVCGHRCWTTPGWHSLCPRTWCDCMSHYERPSA